MIFVGIVFLVIGFFLGMVLTSMLAVNKDDKE